MYLSRIRVRNFRNFKDLDIGLTRNAVIVGENRVGKSNLIFAMRLVLDSSLADSGRQLKLTDICDACDLTDDPEVQVDLDFSEFDSDKNLLALLTDHRTADDHNIARLSYVFRRRPDVPVPATSDADFDFKVFGGGDETRPVKAEVRRRIALDLLPALRDAEGELGSWRGSPLRPLLEEAIGQVDKADITAIGSDLESATKKLKQLKPVETLEDSLRKRIADLTGPAQDINARLGFAPTDPLRLFRSIALYIDDGRRGLSDASVGSANLALLALKLAGFSWRRAKNERNYTVLCVEEPEAHLHPHLQRTVFQKLFSQMDEFQSLFLTTHSPNIASVAPVKSMVLLKQTGDSVVGHSLAGLQLSDDDFEDLQRYLHTTRADIFFSRGVIFVEGDAEEALIPTFAASLGLDLDALGVTVCNVGGVNFTPYVKLATALGLPHSVITDWDPLDGTKPPLGKKRSVDLVDARRSVLGQLLLTAQERATVDGYTDTDFRSALAAHNIFLNSSTLEVEIAQSPALLKPLVEVLEAENFGTIRSARLTAWKGGITAVVAEQLLSMIADVGKGRLSGRFAKKAVGIAPPPYIEAAIRAAIPHG